MSRAFVKESDGDETLPELPLSEHPNYLTPDGLAHLQRRRDSARDQRAALADSDESLEHRLELAHLDRLLRWIDARVASAIVVEPDGQPRDRVAFGATVEVLDNEGQAHRYRIVGEDEADAEHGCVSWLSPLARALIGAQVGDEVRWHRPAGDIGIEVRSIRYE